MFTINPNPTFSGLARLTVPGAALPATISLIWRHMGRTALGLWLREPEQAREAEQAAQAAAQPAAAAPAANPALAVPAANPAQWPAPAANPALASVGADAAWLGRVIQDWSGPVDAKAAPVAYSPDALAALLDAYPAAAGELLAAYLAAMTDSRAKN